MAEDILLTTLKSGDTDNNIFKVFFKSHPDKAEFILTAICKEPSVTEGELKDLIFNEEIDADNYRQLTSALTLADEFTKRTGVAFTHPVTDYYFALVVNKLITDGKAPREARITNISQLTDIHKLIGAGTKFLDYSQYIVGCDHSKQKIKFIKCKVPMKDLSSDIEIKLPVVKSLFGATFRLAMGGGKAKAPASMKFAEDPDEKEYFIPETIWHHWLEELVNKRPTPNFLFAEAPMLKFYIKPDAKRFDEVLNANGMRKCVECINSYDSEINQFHELVIRCAPQYLTEILDPDESDKFEWEDHGDKMHILKYRAGSGFYVVNTNGEALTVFAGGGK